MKNKIKERLIDSSKAKDNSFSIDFWQKAGAKYRFIAMWSMVKDLYKIRGKNASKLRLRRSVQNIKHI
jgi:hypothetical protein